MEEDAGSGQLTSDPRNRSWLPATTVGVAILAVIAAAAGYLAMRDHHVSQAADRAEAKAVAAARDCVLATQPQDSSALQISREKLTDCATGDFGSQVGWYTELLAQAYQATSVKVKVEDLHAGAERSNPDASVIALIAFRAVISQAGVPDRTNSYRVRVKMVPEAGRYKVAQLEQVAK